MSIRSGEVLIVDDDPDLLRLMSIRMGAAGFSVTTAPDGLKALAALEISQPDVVVTDLRMDEMDGLCLFRHIHAQQPSLPVIILTAHGSIPEAVTATQHGVFAFLTKPFDGAQLVEQVNDALRATGAGGSRDMSVTEDDASDSAWRSEIITRSRMMESLLGEARLVAETDARVLIGGDSGTGKELLARAIHKASPRCDKAFIGVNCAAIPEPLLEAELFGYVRGAFTGATRDHDGLFQAAAGGTLFLDEVGDMPLSLQVKLLRVLQEREARPLGSTKTYRIDARIISATHRHLEEEVEARRFREDLYYRLNVVSLQLPGLDERREDIPLLATYFLNELTADGRKDVNGFAPEALELLGTASWPGNIRQLYNVLERVHALTSTPLISAGLVRKALQHQVHGLRTLQEARDEFERDYLVRLLKLTEGNVTHAARMAERNRTDFHKLLRRHGLDRAAIVDALAERGGAPNGADRRHH
ncbi:MAG: sigma 54-interacting transcriptional regulator [Gammaproteobacteria bacterium]|nr:sigma 54-interacting transcriptional regulator [Gammaproteobacteria bacterium]